MVSSPACCYRYIAQPLLNAEREGSSVSSSDIVKIARSKVDGEIQPLETALRPAKSRRNTTALVFRLPPELLCRVFKHVWSMMSGKTSQWVKVTHVCSHWRTIAMSFQELWSHIEFGCREWAQEMLQRAKLVPLTVKVALNSFTADASKSSLVHGCRMRELRIRATDTTWRSHTLPAFPISAQILERFSLHFDHPHLDANTTAIFPDELFSGDILSLRHLELRNCHVSLESSSCFVQLVSLSLSFDFFWSKPSMDQILGVLSDCRSRNASPWVLPPCSHIDTLYPSGRYSQIPVPSFRRLRS
jgi:hypothetical protein